MELYDGSDFLGGISVTSAGTWRFDFPDGLALGLHTFSVHATDGQVSDDWRLTVSAALNLPPPTVTQASGTVLDPLQATGGVDVVVAYQGMLATDLIGLSWDGHTDLAPAQNGDASGRVSFHLPASAVAAVLGKTIQVVYAVVRNGVATPSGILDLVVQPLPQSALDKPTILQAANNGEGPELDVTGLTANATVRLNTWPLIAQNQSVWMKYIGTNADGTSYINQRLSPPSHKVDAGWITNGYTDISASQTELQGLKDGSSLTIEFKAGLDGSQVESQAVTFPLRTYTVKALQILTPAITSIKETASGNEFPANGTTFRTNVTLTGAAASGQQVQIFDGSNSLGVVTATGGNWTLSLTNPTAKVYNIKARGLYGSNPESSVRAFALVPNFEGFETLSLGSFQGSLETPTMVITRIRGNTTVRIMDSPPITSEKVISLSDAMVELVLKVPAHEFTFAGLAIPKCGYVTYLDAQGAEIYSESFPEWVDSYWLTYNNPSRKVSKIRFQTLLADYPVSFDNFTFVR